MLDLYLAKGWRPTGQSLYVSDYLRTESDAIYGCLQTRMDLKDFQFKKRHRRLLQKNDALFRTAAYQARHPDPEMEAVNEAYMVLHPDKSIKDLSFHIFSEQGQSILDTRIFRVYLKDRLIGFSLFDVGKKCLYSKAGIYDPAFSHYSLGIYTMLLEIRWAQAQGFRYYHPGYFAPAYPMFNYKLNYGPIEYFHPVTQQWCVLEDPPEGHPADPYRLCEDKLLELQTLCRAANLQSELLEYPSFTARYYLSNINSDAERLIDGPLLLELQSPELPEEVVVIYHPAHQSYYCYETAWSGLQDFKLQAVSPANGKRRFPRPLAIYKTLAIHRDAAGLVQKIKSMNKS